MAGYERSVPILISTAISIIVVPETGLFCMVEIILLACYSDAIFTKSRTHLRSEVGLDFSFHFQQPLDIEFFSNLTGEEGSVSAHPLSRLRSCRFGLKPNYLT